MVKSISKQFLFIILLIISLGAAKARTAVRGEGLERRTSEIFSVSSIMKWEIFTPSPYLFSITEMYYMQKSASAFFQEKLQASDIFEDQSIILVDYKLRDQTVSIGNVRTTLNAEIVMTYSGKNVMEDFPIMLSNAIDNEDIQYLIRKFVQDGFLGQTSTSSSVKYESNGISEIIIVDKVDKYMLVFVVLITISGVLALSTFSILVTTKCRNDARRRNNFQRDLKFTTTEDTESPVSPSGILGVNAPIVKGDAIITPQRNIVNCYDETPMSMDSNISDAKSTFSSTSSKAPLGIMSMSNLKKLMFSPERKRSTIALYNVGLDDHVEEKSDEEQQER